MTTQKSWHVDKAVSLGILIALVCNIFAGIWYASKIDSRVAALEVATKDNTQVFERLVRVETQLDNFKDAINRIDLSVAKMADRSR
jgi:hypothetical protein